MRVLVQCPCDELIGSGSLDRCLGELQRRLEPYAVCCLGVELSALRGLLVCELEAVDLGSARDAFAGAGIPIERALALSVNGSVAPSWDTNGRRGRFWDETRTFQRQLLLKALQEANWDVSLACKRLGLLVSDRDD
jgi:hypothetical protein